MVQPRLPPEAEDHDPRLIRTRDTDTAQPRSFRRGFAVAAAAGGIAAGVFSTLVQLALWLLFTDDFPAVLWRDTRLTAALVLGPGQLQENGIPGWSALVAATLVHFGLSLIYSAVICALDRRRTAIPALATGSLLGAALYLVNLHGFTLIFPWFAPARGWITLAAHVAFGATAVATCRRLAH